MHWVILTHCSGSSLLSNSWGEEDGEGGGGGGGGGMMGRGVWGEGADEVRESL